jgi:Transposase IS66 family
MYSSGSCKKACVLRSITGDRGAAFRDPDAVELLAAARAAYTRANPGTGPQDAEAAVTSAADAIFTILESHGLLGPAAGRTLAGKAAAAGIALNAGRNGKLQRKRRALAKRMQDREDGYLRFARDLRVPFTGNAAEQPVRMCKLRMEISGCMRSMAGAGEFCAIRSCLATAARHGIGALEALTSAFQGRPWIPGTGQASPAP